MREFECNSNKVEQQFSITINNEVSKLKKDFIDQTESVESSLLQLTQLKNEIIAIKNHNSTISSISCRLH